MIKKSLHLIYCILIGICLNVMSSTGLWVRITVPRYRIPGEMAQLHCDYDLGEDRLYAVKWYKDNEEFYRFVPKDTPKASKHRVDGVVVVLDQSNKKKVVLSRVNLKSSGVYRCEVSGEAPNFVSKESEAQMDVVSLPKEDPIITGEDRQYQVGDQINLNCTSGKSHPASILDWYINEQQVKNDDALIHYQPEKHGHGLVSSILGLQFVLDDRHFVGGSMRVKCVASVSPLLWRGDRESIVQNSHMNDNMREALLLVKSSTPRRAVHTRSSFVTCLILLLLI